MGYGRRGWRLGAGSRFLQYFEYISLESQILQDPAPFCFSRIEKIKRLPVLIFLDRIIGQVKRAHQWDFAFVRQRGKSFHRIDEIVLPVQVQVKENSPFIGPGVFHIPAWYAQGMAEVIVLSNGQGFKVPEVVRINQALVE